MRKRESFEPITGRSAALEGCGETIHRPDVRVEGYRAPGAGSEAWLRRRAVGSG